MTGIPTPTRAGGRKAGCVPRPSGGMLRPRRKRRHRDAPVPGRASGNRYDAQSPLRGEARCASPPLTCRDAAASARCRKTASRSRRFVLDEVEAGRGALTLIERHPACDGTPQLSGERFALVDVQLEAPLPMPRRNLFCVGRNYHAHAKELSASVFKNSAARTPRAWPIVFTKVPECVVGPYDEVRLPGAEVSTQIDYEAELAVVIGTRRPQHLARRRRCEHVFGYTIVNDVTARDVQMRHQQWDLGKSFDTFCPMGPWIVTADELRRHAHARALLGQRRAAPGRLDHRPDLRHPDADRDLLARHHAVSGRRDRHRHAGRRRHGHDAAAVPEVGRSSCGSRSTASARSRTGSSEALIEPGDKMKRRTLLAHAGALATVCAAALPVLAQTSYPDKPVTMIVPFPPGGVADTVARPVAEALGRELKQPVVVENRAGAGGAVGIGAASRAAPDGYTMLLSLSSISILPEADKILDRKPAYQLSQFKPIARFTADPTVLVVRADAPWKTLRRVPRRRARTSREVQLRQLGQLRHDARADGDAEGRGGLSHDAHPVHRRRAGGGRAPLRAGRRAGERALDRRPADPGRQAPRARALGRAAAERAARRAEPEAARPSGALRAVVGAVRSGRNARRDRQEAARGCRPRSPPTRPCAR